MAVLLVRGVHLGERRGELVGERRGELVGERRGIGGGSHSVTPAVQRAR